MQTYTVNYFENIDLLHFKFNGNISVKEIEESITKAYENFSLPKKVIVLVDFKNGVVKFKPKGIYTVFKTSKKFTDNFNSVTVAVVAKDSKETAYSFLFKNLISKSNIYFETFASEEAAKDWISTI